MKNLNFILFALLFSPFLLLFSASAFADTLLIDRMQVSKNILTPQKGQTKSQVEAQFGSPMSKKAAVGTPPISVWLYPKFSVYFEHNHVIHAVIVKASELEKGPKKVK